MPRRGKRGIDEGLAIRVLRQEMSGRDNLDRDGIAECLCFGAPGQGDGKGEYRKCPLHGLLF